MAVQLKPLNQQVIVITGASSGIGLATALAAAQRGAIVVLGARNEEGLADIEREIRAAGGVATAVPVDVAERDDLRRLAEIAVEKHGGFDTWVNNAGLSIFGRLDEVSEAESRRLFDVNFWGVVNGSLEALPRLKQLGGALINIGSVASDLAIPLQAMYSASKHAVKAFTDGLRVELEMEGAPVSVTLIKPTSIDTPFPQHARNYMDREPKLPAPIYTPEEVAEAILQAATRPVRDVYVGSSGKILSAVAKRMPRAGDLMGRRSASQERSEEPARNPWGTLYSPGRAGQVRGMHPGHVRQVSLYNRMGRHPVLTAALLGVAGIGLGIGSGLFSMSRGR